MVLLRVSAFAGTYLAACAAGVAALRIPEARLAWRGLRRMVGRGWVDRPGQSMDNSHFSCYYGFGYP